MAITITKQPSIYSPVSNSLFQVSSNQAGITYFLVTVLTGFDTVLATLKFNVLPSYPNGTYFDLSTILQNYLESEVINTSNIFEPTTKNIVAYRLNIKEYYVNASGVVVVGANYNTIQYYAFKASLSRMEMTGYNQSKYVLTNANTQFLTNSPKVLNVYQDSTEYLYFLNDKTANLNVKFYTKGHVLLGNHTITGTTVDMNAGRLNVSPSVLASYLGESLSNLYGNEFTDVFSAVFGSYADINDTNYYTVQMVNVSNQPLSELRTYVLKDALNCNVKSFELVFSNQYSGMDTIRLFNPRTSLQVSRTTINNNQFKQDEAGIYSDSVNGVYNSTSSIINSNTTYSIKAITDVLSDSQALWLKDIIQSEIVYLRLSNGFLLPVTIKNESYTIQSKRYSRNNNRLELTVETTEDIKF